MTNGVADGVAGLKEEGTERGMTGIVKSSADGFALAESEEGHHNQHKKRHNKVDVGDYKVRAMVRPQSWSGPQIDLRSNQDYKHTQNYKNQGNSVDHKTY